MEGQDTKGESPTSVIFDDSDFEQIANIKPTAPHRNVDLAIFQADKDGVYAASGFLSSPILIHPLGYVRAYIILPSTIYGIAKNPLVEVGIQNPHSQQIPALINAALGRGQAGMVGKGLALWPDVHVDDSKQLTALPSFILLITLSQSC